MPLSRETIEKNAPCKSYKREERKNYLKKLQKGKKRNPLKKCKEGERKNHLVKLQ